MLRHLIILEGHSITLPKTSIYAVLLGLSCSIIALVFLGKDVAANQLDTWKLLPRPERLTQLYFDYPTRLPSTYNRKEPQTVSFTIHNHEYQKTDYHYTVTAYGGNKEVTLATDTISLEHDTSQTTPLTITVPSLAPREEIRVSVEYSAVPHGEDTARPQKQSIHYWVNKK